jgi:hypothetical protein
MGNEPPMKLKSAQHLFSLIPGSGKILHFDGKSNRTTEITTQGKFFHDSAWCLCPNDTLLVCGGSADEGKAEMQTA